MSRAAKIRVGGRPAARTRSERGFALLSTLAALALLSAGALSVIAELRGWSRASDHRTARARAHWAATACLEWMRAEWETERPDVWSARAVRITDELVCRVEDLDPTLRRHLGLSDSADIATLVGAERASTFLDWVDRDHEPRDGGAEAAWYRGRDRLHPPNRPLTGLAETRFIAGWPAPDDPSTSDSFTLTGDGRVDVNRAPPEILRSISALPPHRMARVIDRRSGGARWESAADLRQIFTDEDSLASSEIALFDDLFVFGPGSRVVRIVGEDRRSASVVRVALQVHVRELSDRLAVTRVEVR